MDCARLGALTPLEVASGVLDKLRVRGLVLRVFLSVLMDLGLGRFRPIWTDFARLPVCVGLCGCGLYVR